MNEESYPAFEVEDPRLAEGLRSLPLAETPPRFTVEVMQKISRASRPRFRLTWLDFSLTAFFALMGLLVVVVSRSLPPYFDVYLRQEALYWLQRLQLDPALGRALLAGALMALGGVLTAAGLTYHLISRRL